MFRTGDWVGGAKWPNVHEHPDRWSKPILGQIVDPADHRVWANTFEFPTGKPDLAKVMSLVLKYKAEGKLDNKVPVEWVYGEFRIIKWEQLDKLRPVKDEMVYWKAAKAQRLDQINHPRRRNKRPLDDFLPKGFLQPSII